MKSRLEPMVQGSRKPTGPSPGGNATRFKRSAGDLAYFAWTANPAPSMISTSLLSVITCGL